MVSTLNLDEKFNRIRRNFCFYLDMQDNELSKALSRRIQYMGLQQECFLSPRVTHVVRPRATCARAERRADAMLQRARRLAPAPPHAHKYILLTLEKAVSLLDKLYETFFRAQRKAHVRFFTKHYIKIEFLDKPCRPIYKEFDEWPVISTDPDPPREKLKKKVTSENKGDIKNISTNTTGQKMTRKSRPRIKDPGIEKEQKGGYCEMCNIEYTDARLHRRSPQHTAFVRDHANFLALDSLIQAGTDVATFLDKANGERRSLRKMCNGDSDSPKKRLRRSQSPESLFNGNQSPKRNGVIDDDRKYNTRCAKKNSDSQISEDRQYYKVIGVSTKLRSSGGFPNKRKDSSPNCNGTKPLVVKFRKIRKSELSVLSDEAEQFMFPKRASSSSSSSSDTEEEKEVLRPKRKSPAQPPAPPLIVERRRLARPLALKEESSEEDIWPEEKRRKKRKGPPIVKRARRNVPRAATITSQEVKAEEEQLPPTDTTTKPEAEVSPLREEPVEKCMKWEDGKLKYTPAVEQLEFAFESVPASEPWYETFQRQDQDRVAVRNIPHYFELYSKTAPKLPYEIGQLPPLKPNCCALSDLLPKREEKAGPSRSYGTRGMKKQRIRKRTATILALEERPRKSPREHASTLAILGSAGLLNRRKHADDAKSTASEDTISETHSNTKVEPIISQTQEASERLQQFLSEVFEEAVEYDMSDEVMEGDTPVITSNNAPDVPSLVSECEDCDIIRNEIQAGVTARVRNRKGKFKKKNRTGWPSKKKQNKTTSRTNSSELANSSLDCSSAEPPDDDTTQSTVSEEDNNTSELDKTLVEVKCDEPQNENSITVKSEDTSNKCESTCEEHEEKSVQLDLKVLLRDDKNGKLVLEKDEKRMSRSSVSDCEDKEIKKKKRALQGLLLQPVVRVARVDTEAARRLRSGRARTSRRS